MNTATGVQGLSAMIRSVPDEEREEILLSIEKAQRALEAVRMERTRDRGVSRTNAVFQSWPALPALTDMARIRAVSTP